MEKRLRDMEDGMKNSKICLVSFLESNYRDNGREAMFKEIVAENFLCLLRKHESWGSEVARKSLQPWCYAVRKRGGFVNPGVRFCLPEPTTMQRPWVKPPSLCLTRKQNLPLRTWGIRRKENTSNSKSLDRIAVRFTSK